jgi:acyl-CoA thioester hydrolase
MTEPFRVRVSVRGYELDTWGHLNQAVYLQYGEHCRWELFRAAGISTEALLRNRVGPVVLETTIRYRSELRGGDEVDVTCAFEWGEGKTFQVRQEVRRVDGTLSAEITAVAGLLDLDKRKLVPAPGKQLRALATAPELLD